MATRKITSNLPAKIDFKALIAEVDAATSKTNAAGDYSISAEFDDLNAPTSITIEAVDDGDLGVITAAIRAHTAVKSSQEQDLGGKIVDKINFLETQLSQLAARVQIIEDSNP
jgi:hypothetical protein